MNEAGTVAFRATLESGAAGIFVSRDGGFERVADTEDELTAFHGLPVIDEGGTVVFRADRRDGAEAIYTGRPGSMQVVAETGDLFESLALFPSSHEGTVAFAAVLRDQRGAIVTVADGGVSIVDTAGAFESFRGVVVGGGPLVRIATPRGEAIGLFDGPDPEADRILAVGDPFLGSTVSDLAANPVSVSAAGLLAVRASLADGRELILRTELLGPCR
jgi:hypothetical protein